MAEIMTDSGARSERQTVLVVGEFGERRLTAMMEVADEFGWELLDWTWQQLPFPPDLALSGAIIDRLPDSQVATHLRKLGCPAVRLALRVPPQKRRDNIFELLYNGGHESKNQYKRKILYPGKRHVGNRLACRKQG